jgi:dihydroneopterin aldolase
VNHRRADVAPATPWRAAPSAGRGEIDSRIACPYVARVPTREAITLRGMRFHPRVGVLPHESVYPQPLEVDLTVWLSAGPADAPAVDYRELYALTASAVASQPLGYLESVAADVVARALTQARVVGARAAVRKPHVVLPGPLDYAEVVLERGRRG